MLDYIRDINMLCRYRGSGNVLPPLSKMGGNDWNNTKSKVKKAVEALFNVKVVAVNTVSMPGKEKRMGRYVGKTASSKKAIVTLTAKSKEIEFFQSL